MQKILLIDDDEQLRTALKLLLMRSGYEVSEACNGEEADKIYQQYSPDLVITDVLMPERDGLEVILGFRRKNRNVKILAISGGGRGAEFGCLEIAEKLGAQRSLEKPFSSEQFLETVRSIIGQEG